MRDFLKQVFRSIHTYTIPHQGNNFKPYLFVAESLFVVATFLFVVQCIYIVHSTFIRNSEFMAAVLPAVLTTLANADRASIGAPELMYDPLLAEAAQQKANDMAARGYFAHIDPGGRQPWYWFDAVGYEYKRAGENLAVDFSESVDVEQAWMNSPAHRANLLKKEFTRVGIGVAQGVFEGRNTTFVVQFFATPALAETATAPAPPVPTPEPEESSVVVVADTTPTLVPEVENEDDVRVLGVMTTDTPPQTVVPEPVVIQAEDVLFSEEAPVVQVPTTPGEDIPEVVTYSEQRPSWWGNALTHITSPSTVFVPFFFGVFILLVILLGIAIVVQVRIQYIEVILVGMVLIVFAGALYIMSTQVADHSVRVPTDSQAASVIRAF